MNVARGTGRCAWFGFAVAWVGIAACAPPWSGADAVSNAARIQIAGTVENAGIDASVFGPDFMWGAATSAHQFEGNDVHSDWWAWETGGNTKSGEVSGIATDHYNRYAEDLDLLLDLNLDTYRMSLSWARLYPEPDMDAPDADAVAHYDAVFAALRERGIRPMVTLHHFAMPAWVTDQGRWESGAAIDDFADLTRFAARRWGADVDWWITINEPQVFAMQGWAYGIFPPGKFDTQLALEVYANLVRAHATAYRLIHQYDVTDADGDGLSARVGIARLYVPTYAQDPLDAIDQIVAQFSHQFQNTRWLEANRTGVLHLFYPGAELRVDMPRIVNTLDFIGINYYSRQIVDFDLFRGLQINSNPVSPTGMLGHEVYPRGLAEVLEFVAPYGLPMIITEHGVADAEDKLRKEAIRLHLIELSMFMRSHRQPPVLGYIHWALTDHFEWENGFAPRFGLYEIDYDTLERTQRASAAWLADLLADIKAAD
jgi:beta-glucosidase